MRSVAVTILAVFLAGTSLPAQTPSNVPGSQTPAQATPPPKPPGENQLFIELKAGYNNVGIDPDTRGPDGRPARSFLTPGDNGFVDLTIFQDHSFNKQDRIQFLGVVRNTNDPRIDPEQNSFQRGYLRFITPKTEINYGDYLVSYSRFTYNQNIKGVHVTRQFGEHFKLMANGGVFTDRWGSIFKDYLIGKPYTRVVAGLRAEARVNNDKVFGFNFSEGRDQLGSIRRDLRGNLQGVDNQIVSMDAKLRFGRIFALDGEIAESWTNFDIARLRTKKSDYAARLDTTTRAGAFFLRTTYTRMMPNFLSVNARQLADLQDAGVRGGFDIGTHVSFEAAYRQTSNNLNNDRLDRTTTFRVPEVRASFRQLPGLGRSIFDVGYRERQQEGPFTSATGLTEDRVTRMPFIEASIPIGSTLITAGYEHRDNEDHRNVGQNTATNRVFGGIRSIFTLGGWQISPNFRFETEREVFFRVNGINNNRSILGSLYMEAPKYVVLEFVYRQVGATLFSECLTTASDFCQSLRAIPAGTVVLLPAGFGRPAYRGALTYKILNSEDRTITFSVDRNMNAFALPNRNFDERVIAVTLLYRFRK